MGERIRADVALFERGYAPSREKAKALIMTGTVFVNQERISSAGETIAVSSEIEVKGGGLKYVSRGGLKLEKAIELYHLDLTDYICMDIGASTGGFTDCMLKNSAKKVYAVDVGYGQLAWSLRTDERVINMERTNARYLSHEQVEEELDFATVDVSFISLTLILPVLKNLLKQGGKALCLVKPQFEAGKGKVGKNGVVRELSIHIDVLLKIYDFLMEHGFSIYGATFSPIKGPQGNIEYLYYIKNEENTSEITFEDIQTMAEMSHAELNK